MPDTILPTMGGIPKGIYQSKKQNDQIHQTTIAIQKSESALASGRRVDTLTDGGDQSYSLLNLMESEQKRLSDHAHLQTGIDRLSCINPILNKIHDEFANFQNRIVAMRSQNGFVDSSFQKDAANLLDRMGHLLNSRDHENRFLFGGNKTGFQQTDIADPSSINVVDIARIPTPGVGSPPLDTYFLGTNDIAQLQLADGGGESYGVNGGNPCFAKILHALKIAATTAPTNDVGSVDYQKLTNALDIGGQGQYDLNILKSMSQAQEANFNKNLETIQDDMGVLQDSIARITDQDPVTAFIEKKTLEEKLKVIHQIALMNLAEDQKILEAYSRMTT